MELAFAALFGAILGSFANVVIHRIPRGGSLLRPPSACPVCATAIRPWDNVPVVSYLVLRGRCRACRARISPRYVAVELLCAVLFAAAVQRFGPGSTGAFVALAGLVLVVLAAIDLEHRRVPNVIVLPATGVFGVWAISARAASTVGWWPPWPAIAGMAALALFLGIALISGGMGMGDVKLAALIGAVGGRFGWEVPLLAVFAGFVLGGLIAVVALLTRRVSRRQALPFAPALSAGAVLALFAGEGPVRAWLGI